MPLSIRRLSAIPKLSSRAITDAHLCWIFGAGRSGSTWLLELFSHLENTRIWHEPYFGMQFHFLLKESGELTRENAFYSNAYRAVWAAGIRRLFLSVADARFGPLPPRTRLIIKDVNAPQLCPFFTDFFPRSRFLLLLRDPFDILDSYIDLQRPGSWNDKFGRQEFGEELSPARIRGTADHIRKVYEMAIQGYDNVAPEMRMQLRYEEMLAHPIESLANCAKFFGLSPDAQSLQSAVAAESFAQHKNTGKMAFRRFGKAGIWQTSGNFIPEITAIAQETLGDLRTRLGYTA